MKAWSVAVLALGVALAHGVRAGAQEAPSEPDSPPSGSVYQLPKVGKPTGRLGGGRRGDGVGAPTLYALVPDHVGYTVSEQPTLYWYLADAPAGPFRFEFTLIDAASIDPLVDADVSAPAAPGLQRVDLAEHGISLSEGEEYQWSVAIVTDPEDRSKDIVSSGWIERVAEPDGLSARIAAAPPAAAAGIYGAEGLWYDTLDAAVDATRASPDDAAPRDRLAGLLGDVGLPPDAAER